MKRINKKTLFYRTLGLFLTLLWTWVLYTVDKEFERRQNHEEKPPEQNP